MFSVLLRKIIELSNTKDFDAASASIIDFVDNAVDFVDILEQIGTIPEAIQTDSTEEKLFSKASDAVLSRAFREIGLQSTVLKERANSADVIAHSSIYNYDLVADAKAFRLSRTAKNQKDFKVVALSNWRKDSDYAVLCSPYFHYPTSYSQIYKSAHDENVAIFSWEHMLFLIKNGIKENNNLILSELWNFSAEHAEITTISTTQNNFIHDINKKIVEITNLEPSCFQNILNNQAQKLQLRAIEEKNYWHAQIEAIKSLTRTQAINELIKSKKIMEKLSKIDSFVQGVGGGVR